MALAGLHQGQDLEAFVERAEPAGEQGDGVAFLDEEELAREEVFEVHQLRVVQDDGVGMLLEGEQDVEADAVFAAGADVARLP